MSWPGYNVRVWEQWFLHDPYTVLTCALVMEGVHLTGELTHWVVVLGKERSCFQEPQFHLMVSL